MNRNAEVDLARCRTLFARRLELSPEDQVEPGVEALNAAVKVLEEWINEAVRLRERNEELEAALRPLVDVGEGAEWEYDNIRPGDWKRGWALVANLEHALEVLNKKEPA